MTVTIRETPSGYKRTRIIERPDGFYWQSKDSGEEFGPFRSLTEAAGDMEYADTMIEAGETLQEAESEIGIADWIDPETGQPAEGSVPHIEDH